MLIKKEIEEYNKINKEYSNKKEQNKKNVSKK